MGVKRSVLVLIMLFSGVSVFPKESNIVGVIGLQRAFSGKTDRAPRPPLDTGDSTATGDIGTAFEQTPVNGSGGSGGSVNAFINGGNSFYTPQAVLGTTDDRDLVIRTGTGTLSGQARMTFGAAGPITVLAVLYANGGIDAPIVLNLGTGTANAVAIGRSGATISLTGDTTISDKRVTLNKGGAASSAGSAGIELEENGAITGYVQTSADRSSWMLKAPNTAGVVTITPGVSDFTVNQGSHNPVTIGTPNGLSLSTQQLSLAAASGSTTGALTSADWTIFNGKQDGSANLTSLAGITTDGFIAHTALNTFTPRTITGTTDQVAVLYGDGVIGNPVLSLPQSIATTSTPVFSGLTVNTGAVLANGGIDTSLAPTVLNLGTVTTNTVAIGKTGTVTRAPGAIANLGSAAATIIGISASGQLGTTTTGSFSLNGTLELPGGRVTMGGTRYIHATGTRSFFAGLSAGSNSVNGSDNTAVGAQALMVVDTGNNNTALGSGALRSCSSGAGNTAIGSGALGVTDGSNNTVVGASALPNSPGSDNTMIGYAAGSSHSTSINNICIGSGVTGSGAVSNVIRIGNSTNTTCYITGINAASLGSSAANIVGVDPVTSQLGTSTTGGFTLTGSLRITGAATINSTLELTTGLITMGAARYITAAGTQSFAAGPSAGPASGGSYNTAIGYHALTAAGSSVLANTAIGSQALASCSLGSRNTALGYAALANTDGGNNTAVGYDALLTISGGTDNTVLGFSAGSAYSGGAANNICIGSGVTGTAGGTQGETRIGIQGTQQSCYIAGISGVVIAGVPVFVASDGRLGVSSSSRRYKENINPINSQDRFMQFNPVSFTYKTDTTQQQQFGLIAEEVEEIYPELVTYKDGQVESVKYHLLDALLIREIQENRMLIKILQDAVAEIPALRESIANLKSKLG